MRDKIEIKGFAPIAGASGFASTFTDETLDTVKMYIKYSVNGQVYENTFEQKIKRV